MKVSVIATCVVIYTALLMADDTSSVMADEFSKKDTRPLITDVALDAQGTLTGIVLSDDARPAPNAPVRIYSGDRVVARASTDGHGRFHVAGLRNGVHHVTVADSRRSVRLWSAQTAPPAASRGLTLVSSRRIIRGQQPDGLFPGGLPMQNGGILLIGGAAAFAIGDSLSDSSGFTVSASP